MKNTNVKTQNELKNEFFRHLNSSYRISESSENAILNLNKAITSSFQTNHQQPKSHINVEDNKNSEQFSSQTLNQINTILTDIQTKQSTLTTLNTEVDSIINKLSTILLNRDHLQSILKDFNQSTKEILTSKDKMKKLIQNIDSIYKIYEQTLSIQAFLDNNACVLKYRFLSDFDEIEKGINFFTLNSNYTEAQKYLNTYTTLKITCINKYYQYIYESINKEETESPSNDSFLCKLILSDNNNSIQSSNYLLYSNYIKMKERIDFFEEKAKNDNEIKHSQNKLKTKYISNRIKKMDSLYKNITSSITKLFYDMNNEINNNQQENNNDKRFNKRNLDIFLHNNFYSIVINTICEIIHYSMLFTDDIKNDVYLIQSFTDFVFTNLYNTIRPIIVSIVSLEQLISLFDAFSHNFGIFFIEINDDNLNNEKEHDKIASAWYNLTSTKLNNKELKTVMQLLFISRYLIRPTILHLVQDIQEKIYYKINYHVKNNFVDIELDFPSFGLYEESLYEKYSRFSLFHYFLKRIVIVHEIFSSKLDDKILNVLIISSIETFISILNTEILNKRNLNYEFQIYIIQQILLCLEIVEQFKLETVEDEVIDVGLDFNFITEMFKTNYDNITKGKFTIAQVLSNSAPKILEKTRDFKKILYNNLLKSYKMYVNLANEFIFGRNMVNVYNKITSLTNGNVNKNDIDDIFVNNQKEFVDKMEKIEESKGVVLKHFEEQIKIVDTSVNEKLNKIVCDNVDKITKGLVVYVESYSEENDTDKEMKNKLNYVVDYLKNKKRI